MAATGTQELRDLRTLSEHGLEMYKSSEELHRLKLHDAWTQVELLVTDIEHAKNLKLIQKLEENIKNSFEDYRSIAESFFLFLERTTEALETKNRYVLTYE